MAGFATSWAIWLAGLTAGAQFVGMLLSSLYIEKLGRRTLLLSSLAVVVLSLVTVGTQKEFAITTHTNTGGGLATDRMVHAPPTLNVVGGLRPACSVRPWPPCTPHLCPRPLVI